MTEPEFLPCRGFDENVVLAVKNCFYEEEMRLLVMERAGERVLYHHRQCAGLVPYRGLASKMVSVQCNVWFNSLEQHYLPQLSTTNADFDLFPAEVDTADYRADDVAGAGSQQQTEARPGADNQSDISKFEEEGKPKKVNTSKEKFECDLCGLKFNKKKSLGIHKGKRHKETFVNDVQCIRCNVEGCDLRDKVFDNILQYKNHMRISHKLPRRGRKPKADLYSEETNLKDTRSCDICGKGFDSRMNLIKHVKRSHETKQKPCHICGMMVKELTIHVKHQHLQKDLKKYFCEFCGRGFKGYSGYHFHVAGHTGEKKYSCGGCGKSFRTSSESKKCERGHQGIFKWNCSLCSYRCHQKNKFVRHMRTHTKSEPYGCPLCDHRAARKDYLQKHIHKAHKGVSLESLESLHPNMYNIEEKITFEEGRESQTTEQIQEKVWVNRLSLLKQEGGSQQDLLSSNLLSTGEILVTAQLADTPENLSTVLRRETVSLFKI